MYVNFRPAAVSRIAKQRYPLPVRQEGPWTLRMSGCFHEEAALTNPHSIRDVARILGMFIKARENLANPIEIGFWGLVNALPI